MLKIQFYSRPQVAVKQFSISEEGKLYSNKNQYEHLGCSWSKLNHVVDNNGNQTVCIAY